MLNFESLEPAIDPNNRITFLLDWELTMKCNLDCSYCATGLYGGHDNTTRHPPLDQCVRTIDFMFKYVDLYMSSKPKAIKYVVLNVYGGESLHHPNIIEILNEVRNRYQQLYADCWKLIVTTTTNAILPDKKLQKIIPLIDEFTVSYHSENSVKQKQQFKNNLLAIANSGKKQKCIVLMHEDPALFQDSINIIQWLKENNIRDLPRQLDDNVGTADKRNYHQKQIIWFDDLYKTKNFGLQDTPLRHSTKTNLTDVGRACCGGRQTCQDQNYKQRHFYVENKFTDWYCSVNHFFVYIKQVNGEIYVNKDCKMNFQGQVGPIGNLSDTEKILADLETGLYTKSLPIIQCKKHTCLCGLCAPKAKKLTTYKKIMEKYQL